jgi:DNA-binding CsgD family transcriptional regulator
VTALAARDAKNVLRFVATAEELADDHAFTPEVLVDLGKLVEADWVGYNEMDRVRKRFGYGVGRLGDEFEYPEISYWEISAEHPVCSRHNTGEFRALKLSDFMSLKELRKSRIYSLWFRPSGVEHELNVAIPSPPWHTKTFLFDRGPGRDFTERDRRVLDLLQPHVARLWRAAQVRRQLRAALASLDEATGQDACGVLLLAPGGAHIEFASRAAQRLLGEFFGEQRNGQTPDALFDWFESGSEAFVCRRGRDQLTISRSNGMLLLEPTRDELGLTSRERDVLAWVARGKTNPEVAEILWVTPSTVRKHLENIYAKLGVHTRTAAVTRFLGALGD